MSYVDAYLDRKTDTVKVVERIKGERLYNDIPAEYVFYFKHGGGTFTTIYGQPCKKITTNSSQVFRKKLGKFRDKGIFESDVNPIFRCLANNYRGIDAPELNVSFFDIEAAFDPEVGYAPTDNPFNVVNAISIYNSWMKTLFTLALIPPTLTLEEGQKLGESFENTIIFDDEKELLAAFLDLIEDADVLSGWNSEGYDIPYLTNRIKRVLGEKAARRLCLWDQAPREREYEKFKRKHKTYDLVGRVHLDYLLLYQKHNPQQLHSYRLDYVGEIEVGENKVPYEGTLDDLWRKDFDRFIEYSRQDTMLLPKIDAKKKFIELANQVAHGNCVLLKTTMGSVALVEQAIINEMHEMGFIVPDRKKTQDQRNGVEEEEIDEEERTPVVGAYVADPKKGSHNHVACCDINSLYPSAIRALNMSPETIVGQVRSDATMALVEERIKSGTARAEAWDGLFHTLEYGYMMNETDDIVTVDVEDGKSQQMTGKELYAYIFNPRNKVCITANGTIFTTAKDGMIPMLLARWYSERKTLQKAAARYTSQAKGVKIDDSIRAALGK